jgi:hypothetical protein
MNKFPLSKTSIELNNLLKFNMTTIHTNFYSTKLILIYIYIRVKLNIS